MFGNAITNFRFATKQEAFNAIRAMEKRWRRGELSLEDINALYEPVFYLEECLAGNVETDAALRVMEALRTRKIRYRRGRGNLVSAICNHMKCDMIDAFRKEQRRLAKAAAFVRHQAASREDAELLSRPDNMEGREEDLIRESFPILASGAFSIPQVCVEFASEKLCPARCRVLVEGLLAGVSKGKIASHLGISRPAFTRMKDKTLAILCRTRNLWMRSRTPKELESGHAGRVSQLGI